ncbi:KpsF/GutQ family sugar-phosphate isomerase [Neisseria sp. ZJ106]|uniref:KpsF/GutQ family sugar-phosphate isomerase n=1 Tax=Neisseria lisongii TaxID=2912188 RepID=A0ABY7RNY8_9NEIS|nr:KpsF/GutQ family sugar-phosphate isomerase [Neisseria lisongii]MCF7522098.1 KpsF/GutQ family sugar-phosphate isomerase [Neisseria lisongii]WCL71960.1 KpsF/GutQ family sugar-phosphate isomerase [Neisseria lisongii]
MNHLVNAQEALSLYQQAISRLNNNLSDSFNQAIDLILSCEGRLVVSGIGKSGLVGKKMVATFASTGTPSFFLHPTEAFHGDLGMLKPIDIVILISYSGETDDINKLIPSLKNFGNKIIAITGKSESTLAQHADIVLDISIEREACPNNLAPTTSSLITMALGDALAIALIKARDFKAEDFALYHPGGSLGRKLLCRVKDVMIRKLPLVAPNASFEECLTAMNEGRIGVAIVVENHQLKGIITDGDIRRLLARQGANSLSYMAENMMSKNPKTISEDEYIGKAEEKMKELHIHSLVALDAQGQISGVVEFTS